MVIKQASSAEVRDECLRVLGFSPGTFDLTAPEVLAAALRRAAGFLCPCPRATLRRAVTDVLAPLAGAAVDDATDDVLEALVAHGDLHEFPKLDPREHHLYVYAAAPAYLARPSGMVFLLGIVPDRPSPLPGELEHRIEYIGHVRRIAQRPGEDLRLELHRLGLREVSAMEWTKAPAIEAAAIYVSRFNARLAAADRAGDIPNLIVLNPTTPVHLYKGRWSEPAGLSGRFVGRRPQRYGADLWCYVELLAGIPQRMVELPLVDTGGRGCDEAWRLQAAIDAVGRRAQRFSVSPGSEAGTMILAFFSPLPGWAQRRLDLVGSTVRVRGSLFAYCIPDRDSLEEIRFSEQVLWLEADRQPRVGGSLMCN